MQKIETQNSISDKNMRSQKNVVLSAPDEKCFWVCDGRILRNLNDLAAALKSMSEPTFKYHVSKSKNDFMKWIKEVLQDNKLARSLRRVKTRMSTLEKVEARIKALQV